MASTKGIQEIVDLAKVAGPEHVSTEAETNHYAVRLRKPGAPEVLVVPVHQGSRGKQFASHNRALFRRFARGQHHGLRLERA